MAQNEPIVTAQRLTPVQWVICAIAAIGFAFDTYVLLVLPLIVRPALAELVKGKPTAWVGYLFYIPAVAGGIFGLLGGYLTDRLGRRRVLVWSILLYAFSAVASGYSTSAGMLLALRCTTFIGVSVEFVAAVAWLAELFPDAKQREAVLGYTQAFGSLGGLMISAAFGFLVTHASSFPAIYGGHKPWRYALISGIIPAIPLILIRPFLPESPTWQAKKAAGQLKRPSLAELFQPEFRRTTLVTTLMFACSYGAAFGAIQQMPRIVPTLPQVVHLPELVRQHVAANVQLLQETGGLLGRVLLAILALRVVSRRRLLHLFQVPGLFIVPFVFFYPATHDLGMVKIGIFLAGLFTVAQFSFWGNYLPRMYPTHLRGTGEGFAANIGGRMIGTSAALITTQLEPALSLPYAAAVVALLVYGVGFLASFWLPEPKQDKLPE